MVWLGVEKLTSITLQTEVFFWRCSRRPWESICFRRQSVQFYSSSNYSSLFFRLEWNYWALDGDARIGVLIENYSFSSSLQLSVIRKRSNEYLSSSQAVCWCIVGFAIPLLLLLHFNQWLEFGNILILFINGTHSVFFFSKDAFFSYQICFSFDIKLHNSSRKSCTYTIRIKNHTLLQYSIV